MKEIVIDISSGGEVRIETKGFKGKACLEESQFLKNLLGKEIYKQLNEAWRASEGIGTYFNEEKTLFESAEKLLDSVNKSPVFDKDSEAIKSLQRKIDSIRALKETENPLDKNQIDIN